MYYDLSVPYVPNQAELQTTLAFLAERKLDRRYPEALRTVLTESQSVIIL